MKSVVFLIGLKTLDEEEDQLERLRKAGYESENFWQVLHDQLPKQQLSNHGATKFLVSFLDKLRGSAKPICISGYPYRLAQAKMIANRLMRSDYNLFFIMGRRFAEQNPAFAGWIMTQPGHRYQFIGEDRDPPTIHLLILQTITMVKA